MESKPPLYPPAIPLYLTRMIKLLAMFASLLAGSMIAFQAPINARLGNVIGGPLVAIFFSFAVGAVAFAG